jgi:transposase
LAKIQSAKAALEREVREASKETVDPKAQKSFHDLEAQPSARTNGSFMYSYNCQAAVDADNQIIVAAEVHDSTSDAAALAKVLESVEANCERSADEVLGDSAYNTYSNLEATSAKGSKAYFATGKGEDEATKDAIDALKYYGNLDQFRCQGGKALKSVSKRSTGTRGLMTPRAHCRGCPLKHGCQVYSRAAKTFWIPDAERFTLAREHRRRMASPTGKAVYARRKVIVEPVFGNLKNKGIRILRKGRRNASTWWKMACTAHNIEKIVKSR